MNAEEWRSRPGDMGDRERYRAVRALVDIPQTHLRVFGGDLP